MIYKGQFRSKDNTLYTVKITTEGTTQSKEITLGGTPFVTSMLGDGIYKPAKYTGATVAIVTPSYHFDIYSGKAQGTKVELYKGNSVEWTGYATPNLYDMGFTKYKETIEIECIDALSTLQYIKYNAPKRNIVSFYDIINKTIKECNAYTGFVVSANTQLNKDITDTILDKLHISDQNFFNKKKDKETDNDVAWTCQEILEEVCQYLGLTAVADKDIVYFLDYDAIKNGINEYYSYSIDNPTPTKITLAHSKTIIGSDYSGGGSSLSMDNVYNKVTVTDDFYTFDEVLPDMFDNAVNITANQDAALQYSDNINNGMYGEVVSSKVGDVTDSQNKNMIVMLDRVRNPESGGYSDLNVVFVKYFNNPYYKFFKYDANGRDITDTVKSLNYTDTKSMNGATIAKFCVKKLDKGSDVISNIIFKILSKQLTLDDWLAMNEFSKVDFSDYIVLLNPNHINNEHITKFPYFQTVVSDTTALFGGENAYLIISGNYMYHYFSDDPYPIPEGESDIAQGRYAMDAGQTFLMAKLQWGNLYWSGDQKKGNNGWVTTETTFKIPYMKDDASKKDRRADSTMFKDLKFVNTVNWRIGTNEQGYLITLPKNGVIGGMPTLTVYKPFDPNYHSVKSGKDKGQHYKHSCVFLKDFKFKAIIGDPTFSKVNETDTVYTNVINDAFVTEFDEVNFKVCTYDEKKPNYSSVALKEGATMKYLDTTYNKATKQSLRQEEHYIYKTVNQYKEPSIILNLDLKNNFKIYGLYKNTTIKDKSFILNSLNIDYRHNSSTINLIEKK